MQPTEAEYGQATRTVISNAVQHFIHLDGASEAAQSSDVDAMVIHDTRGAEW